MESKLSKIGKVTINKKYRVYGFKVLLNRIAKSMDEGTWEYSFYMPWTEVCMFRLVYEKKPVIAIKTIWFVGSIYFVIAWILFIFATILLALFGTVFLFWKRVLSSEDVVMIDKIEKLGAYVSLSYFLILLLNSIYHLL